VKWSIEGTATLAATLVLVAACGTSTATPTPAATLAAGTATAAATAAGTGVVTTAAPGSPSPTAAAATGTPAPSLPRSAWIRGQTVHDYSLPAAGVGWVWTNRGIWETGDDGATWANATPAHLIVGKIRGVAALDAADALIGVADVSPGTTTYYLWRTRDGGASWTYVALPGLHNEVPATPCAPGDFCGNPGDPPVVFDFVDDLHAYALITFRTGVDGLDPHAFYTSDGGAHWSAVTYTPTLDPDHGFGITGIFFESATNGVIAVSNEFAGTTSGWGHWTARLLDPDYYEMRPVYFAADDSWIVSGGPEAGALNRFHYAASSNHGGTWTDHVTMIPGIAGMWGADVQFLSTTEWVGTCLADSGRTTIHTTDGGAHWAMMGPQPTGATAGSPLSANLRFADGRHGWTGPEEPNAYYPIGHGGKIYTTIDGGLNWRLITP
jgi:photosystem II stability/assembly factor-like uncharacterized protein